MRWWESLPYSPWQFGGIECGSLSRLLHIRAERNLPNYLKDYFLRILNNHYIPFIHARSISCRRGTHTPIPYGCGPPAGYPVTRTGGPQCPDLGAHGSHQANDSSLR